jgi:hypothetical protein
MTVFASGRAQAGELRGQPVGRPQRPARPGLPRLHRRQEQAAESVRNGRIRPVLRFPRARAHKGTHSAAVFSEPVLWREVGSRSATSGN